MFREFIAINPSHEPQQELWEGQLIEHSEKVARLTNVHDKLRAHNPETIVYPESFNAVPIELLKAVHTPEYIDYLLSLKKHGWDEYRLASSFADFALTTPYYYQMAREIMQLGLPTVFVQEGGYNTEAIGDNALSLVKGIEEGLKY